MIRRVPLAFRSALAFPFLILGAVGILVAVWISPETFGHREDVDRG